MAPRAFWKGYLKLSLVTCPVALTPAVSEVDKVRLHTLDRRTGNRVESRSLDAVTGHVVDEDDAVKGYQAGEDRYVILEDEEIDAVALETTRTIDIETFVPATAIGWIWYDRPHFLVPDDAVGEEAFAVIRTAMEATGMVGIARLVLYRRERAVLIEPRDRGIVLWTLRFGDEVRDAGPYFAGIAARKVPADLMALVKRLIDERTRAWDPSLVADPVQESLLEIIAAKRRGKRRKAPKAVAAERPGNVVSILDALRSSIAAERPKRR